MEDLNLMPTVLALNHFAMQKRQYIKDLWMVPWHPHMGHHWCTEKVLCVPPCLDLSYWDWLGRILTPSHPRLSALQETSRQSNHPRTIFIYTLSFQPVKQFIRHLWCAGSCAKSCGEDGRMRSSLRFQIPWTPSEEEGSLHQGRQLSTKAFAMCCRSAEVRWQVRVWDRARNHRSPKPIDAERPTLCDSIKNRLESAYFFFLLLLGFG